VKTSTLDTFSPFSPKLFETQAVLQRPLIFLFAAEQLFDWSGSRSMKPRPSHHFLPISKKVDPGDRKGRATFFFEQDDRSTLARPGKPSPRKKLESNRPPSADEGDRMREMRQRMRGAPTRRRRTAPSPGRSGSIPHLRPSCDPTWPPRGRRGDTRPCRAGAQRRGAVPRTYEHPVTPPIHPRT